MSRRFVPVNMGSPRFRSVEVDGLLLTRAWFPPGLTLPPHHHERTCLAVVLEGALDCTIAGRTYECPPDGIWTEPAGERHGNRFGSAGAHVLVLQPDSTREDLWSPCAGLFERINSFRHAGVADTARRLVREMSAADDLAPLALEAFALEMVVVASRTPENARRSGVPPAWLDRAVEIIHDRFRDPLRVAGLARELEVHPVHLGRVFRRHKRVPIATYIRRLRLDWAARQLETTDRSLSAVAIRAGFADQSHFTRAFKQHTGETPGQYRVRTTTAKSADVAVVKRDQLSSIRRPSHRLS